MPGSAKEKLEQVLILCVDRDDDIGVKASIKTPILGREENLYAATNLALQDPEEPDANAIFGAIKVFDSLTKTGELKENLQIATISGSDLGGVGADRKLVSQLNSVLKEFPASDVILVTDGYSDEAILPLIQSRVPVTSVRRIVVKHSESIEETAAIFSRYLKMLWQNPRYSRIAFGLPGVLLMVLGILALAQVPPTYLGIAFLIVFGAVFVIKGFGMDKVVQGFYKWIREYSPPALPVQIAGFSTVAGILLVLMGIYLGGGSAADTIPELQTAPIELNQWLGYLPRLAGEFISESILSIVIGICVLLFGRAIRCFFERDPRLWRTIVIVVVVAWSWTIFRQAADILIARAQPDPETAVFEVGLAFSIIIGILLAVGVTFITFLLHKRFSGFFGKREVEVEEFKEG